MKANAFSYGIRDFADELGGLIFQNDRLKEEVAELLHYRQKYMDLLNESLVHNQRMAGSLLQLAMKPGVLEACAQTDEHGRPHADATT